MAAAMLLVSVTRVTAAGKPQAWLRLRSPNFIVISNASEKQARRVAYQFEMIRAVFRRIFNLQSPGPDSPITIIAARDESTLQTLLPEDDLAKGSSHPSGVYVGGPEKNYVALRLDVTLNREASEPFEPVYHEYVHYLTRRLLSQLPLWLTEGLAEFYGNTRVEGQSVWVGAPSSANLNVLRQHPLLPLSTLFAVNPSSSFYHEEDKASIYYAESWALTHYLMTRDWREKTERLAQFMALLGQNKTPEEAAPQTIGEPSALQEQLRDYIGRFAFTAARFEMTPEVDENSIKPEPISEAELLAIQGDFLVHTHRYADARQTLEASLKSDPKLAGAYESMGLLCAEQDKTEEANKWYSEAVALNSESYIAHFYYASNLLKGRLDDDTAAKAEASLRTAIKINPAFAPSYDALAYLLIMRNRGLEEARMLVLQAISVEPGDVHYRLRMAQLLERMERTDDALRVATLAAPMAKTPEEWTETQSTLESIRRFQEYQRHVKEQQEAVRKARNEAARPTGTALASQTAPALGARSLDEENQPPPLRHRDAATADRPSEPGLELAATSPYERPEVLARHEAAEGIITESKCSGRATLELTLASSAGTRQLFSDDYFKIPYSALNYTPQGVLNPCVDMKGMRARITYRPAKNQPQQGEIVAVQLVK
jgi:tetratricopeptide (TPR) repeat protein